MIRYILLISLIGWRNGSVFSQTVSFRAPVSYQITGAVRGNSFCNTCMAVSDLNGDGIQDIVFSNSGGGLYAAGVLIGNRSGGFDLGSLPNSIELYSRSNVLIADFNGDGKPDIHFDGPTILLGKGDGSFEAPIKSQGCLATAFSADLNHDGKADLVCGDRILLSNGDGTFKTSADKLQGNVILLADFNSDGKPDLLVVLASPKGQLAVMLSRGDGGFLPAAPIGQSALLVTPLAGDFDGDGKIDLIGVSPSGPQVLLFRGRGDGSFEAPVVKVDRVSEILAIADFNGDGKLDLVSGSAVRLGNGDGSFRYPIFLGVNDQPCGGAILFPCGGASAVAVVADFNGDGKPDIAAGFLNGGISNQNAAKISILINDSPGYGFTVTGVSAATGTSPVSPGSIVSAYGVNLGPRTESAGDLLNPPTTLGGVQLSIKNRYNLTETLAPLLYVSPTQINYIMPKDLNLLYDGGGEGLHVWISINGKAKALVVPLNTLAPGFFTISPGLAAATAFRLNPDGSQTSLQVTDCRNGSCSLTPIELLGGPVYLSFYGTGFTQASTLKSHCEIGGQTVPVLYAGPQLQIAGLDQINLSIPSSLAGSGEVTVSCTFAPSLSDFPRIASNEVRLLFR